ncbi:pyridoxal phosphate-dependent transferase [Zychaea mexicana]|uniref:pyridoxal phosphate-dependent transferase n=1 Tax=Zychaea mexicana TaxID=64656 RepID=UPI0022FE8870|nr:pyridoxal phosphate-dependent transferase [Zychaea mexicana]KAI9477071.1 pyridoxal phosphate-dependent transferase [Zychaea mexicana]
MTTVPEPPTTVGAALPANTPHAVSVMFPTWQDNVYYEEGNPIVTSKMECGYPRFFVHPFIQKLCDRLTSKYGKASESGMLFPSRKIAERCREFLKRYFSETEAVRIVELKLGPVEKYPAIPIFLVLFPKDAFKVAKQFWQHSGDILSSRMAEQCLQILDDQEKQEQEQEQKRPAAGGGSKGRYANKRKPSTTPPLSSDVAGAASSSSTSSTEDKNIEAATYVEERYGRNLPIEFADHAKVALRRRIAGILATESANIQDYEKATETELENQRALQGDRGIKGLSENDVYLYPCGMSAIFHAHRCAMTALDASLKSVCFGFPYTDTLKILQKFGAGCYFYGLGEDNDIDDIEAKLKSGERILSLFCEVPSNPLLKTPDLKRLRKLADEYNFMIVVDETLGNFSNVNVLQHADMVVSSLTKVFSGDSNVMGGSMVLNPNRKHYQAIKAHQEADFEDLVWCEDALFLERNSRNFKSRSKLINENAEALCDYLASHPKVNKVFYPKFVCNKHYEAVKNPAGGYGGLFSLMLKSEKAAQVFYDNLHCAKGPSLGTNFTLVSPYTILAHYTELDWAEKFGVSRYLVRVSVGLEQRDRLLKTFQNALDAVVDEV